MLVIPQKGVLRVQHNAGGVGTNAPGTAVTAGTSLAKGTPAQLFSSTSFDVFGIWLMTRQLSTTAGVATDAAMDILIGSATEEVIIPNLLCGYSGNPSAIIPGQQWFFPIYIPAGNRIAAQVACEVNSQVFQTQMHLYGGHSIPPWRVGSKVVTYGMGTVPDGTSITAGGSGTEGSWTQITASTSEDHFAVLPSIQCASDTGMNTSITSVDIGVGSATEEEVVNGGGWFMQQDSNETMSGCFPEWPAFQDIPSGTRLAMRLSNSGGAPDAYTGVIHAVA